MATNFPTSLDTLTNPTSGQSLNSPSHASQHANANDAIEALQAKVGADSSAVNTSHDYKLSGVATGDKSASLTGTETLTNKTLTSPTVNLGTNATGDMYYRDGSGVFQRLAIGSTSQILNVDASGIPAWIANPSASAASDTTAGIVELATTAETTTGTATDRAVTPDGLHDMTSLAGATWFLDEDDMATDSATKVASQQSIKAYADGLLSFKNGATTRAGDTASGDQTIAHGLGRVPKFIRITVTKTNSTNGGVVHSSGVYNGTTNSCVYSVGLDTGNGNVNGQSGNRATQCAYVQQIQPGATGTQTAIATFDSTNITLTWTKSGTVSNSNMNILWEAV